LLNLHNITITNIIIITLRCKVFLRVLIYYLVKMNFIQRIRAAFDPSFDEIIRAWKSGNEIKTLTPLGYDTAMRFSAVFACFRVLAETFASVPIFEYKKISDSEREKTNGTGLYDILHVSPNDEMSAYNYREALMYQICAGGNAVSKRIYGGIAGGIAGLYPLQWQFVRIERNRETKKLEYIFENGTEKEILTRDEIFHIPGPSMNGVIGMSVLEYAMSSIRLGLTYERFSQNYFDNAAMPSGIFTHPGFLKPEAYERLKKDLAERNSDLTHKGTPILAEDGLAFTPFQLKMVDAELLSSKKLQLEDICRFCRVPLHLVQNLDRSTNNNIEHQSLEFIMYTMLPHFKRAEECINSQLLTKNQRASGYYFEHNISTLLRGDSKSMADAFAVGRQWGWLSVNDIRRLLNMNSIGPAGDIYLTPLNMYEAGKEPPAQKGTIDESIKKEIENLVNIASRA
jgi:HK97 family phage portal protein